MASNLPLNHLSSRFRDNSLYKNSFFCSIPSISTWSLSCNLQTRHSRLFCFGRSFHQTSLGLCLKVHCKVFFFHFSFRFKVWMFLHARPIEIPPLLPASSSSIALAALMMGFRDDWHSRKDTNSNFLSFRFGCLTFLVSLIYPRLMLSFR